MTQSDIQTIVTQSGKELKVHTQLFINNEFVPGNGPLIEDINPSTEEVICKVHSATEEDVNTAVEAAHTAYKKVWSKVAPAERGALLNKLADLMERDQEELAMLEAIDNGKAVNVARDEDIAGCIGCYRYFAGWADKIHGKVIDTAPEQHIYTRHEALGVVGAIIPWNYPLMMGAWKFAPALAAGNAVVMKTSELTPLSAYKFATLIKEAGFPAGVVNIITGYGHITGSALAAHPRVSKMAFTGSTGTGRKVMEASSTSNLKKLQLELGGKSAQLVFADADLKHAAQQAAAGIYNNHGQNCNAGSRIFVHESVAKEFIDLFTEQAKAVKVGCPFKEDTFQGPQVSKAQFDKIMDYIKIGQDEGATLHFGGKRVGDKGYFIQPTVFTNCNNNMRLMREEIFGPVVAIGTFSGGWEEAVELANDSEYGLAAGVYTSDHSTAIKASNALLAGSVWVNCYDLFNNSVPFGGYKQSGFGKELGKYALLEYLQVKSVITLIDW